MKKSADEKKAIIFNVIAFVIILGSSIIRLVIELTNNETLKNNLAYNIIDGVCLFIGIVCLVFAFVYEKKIKKAKQEEKNKK